MEPSAILTFKSEMRKEINVNAIYFDLHIHIIFKYTNIYFFKHETKFKLFIFEKKKSISETLSKFIFSTETHFVQFDSLAPLS